MSRVLQLHVSVQYSFVCPSSIYECLFSSLLSFVSVSKCFVVGIGRVILDWLVHFEYN